MFDRSYISAVKKILIEPATKGATLTIVTHKATPSMASWLLKTYEEQGIFGLSIEIILTFSKQVSGDTFDCMILKNNHEGFKELQKRFCNGQNNFSCSYYYGREVCADNLYIWRRGAVPFLCFRTNCEFTQPNLLNNNTATFTKEKNIWKADNIRLKVCNESIYCDNIEAEDYIIISQKEIEKTAVNHFIQNKPISLPLITKRTGEPGQKSGLNWGQRAGRNPNEAYIPLPIEIAQSGFFPLNKQHFLVVTDDHHTLLLRVEQQNDKAITTPASNALLGEYFRNRLNLKYGARITLADLEAYGRTDVVFYKIDDEQYYMDFSAPRKKK